MSSPKIRKNNEQFNSCYCGILFDYCHSCVSGVCTIHYTIKCNSECERIFHVSCTDINKNYFLNSSKTKETSCFEIYSSFDKIKLLTSIWLCVKCKYKQNNRIKTSNFEENSIFEKKCLNMGLKMSSKITRQEQRTTLKKIKIIFYVNCIIFVQKIYITT